MLYLLDANVLIDASRDYYPLDRIPEFWDWLIRQGRAGAIKVPQEVWDEVAEGTDELSLWLRTTEVKSALLLEEECEGEIVNRVVTEGYAQDLTDDELETLGRDPFLIAYAVAEPTQRSVATTERSAPGRTRGNKRIPKVREHFGVRCCSTFELIRRLDFRTSSS